MNRCLICIMPDTRPDTPFVDGVCSACHSYRNRPAIDWASRKTQLEDLLEKHRNGSGFDCIVPSSGGKDSHYQVLTLLALGARPLVVTATTCHLTEIGRKNIDNLARYATTIEVTPNREVRAKLNRLGLDLVGDISWPEHVSIFTTPFNIAAKLGIPLIFYGENPQNQYGGPQGSEEAMTMTQRWRSEFGGFLGLRPHDLAGMDGLTRRDMTDYMMPDEMPGIQAHFLGQYIPWDSHHNARIARDAGMIQVLPCETNWWNHENLDNAQTGLHDYLMYSKYGYNRAAAQLSVDVRAGLVTRKHALEIALEKEPLFPHIYGGVMIEEVLERIKLSKEQLCLIIERFSRRPQ